LKSAGHQLPVASGLTRQLTGKSPIADHQSPIKGGIEVKRLSICLLATILLGLALVASAFGQGSAGPVPGGINYSMLASAFSDPSVSWSATGLTLTYSNGTVYQGGAGNSITGSTLTLTTNLTACNQAGIQAGTCNIVYWPGSGSSLSVSSTYATAAAIGNRILYFCTTNSSGNISGCAPPELDVNGAIPVTYGDAAFFVQPSNCLMTPTTTAFSTSPALTRVGANQLVYSGTTNTTAGTIALTCDITFGGRTTAGLGFQVTGVSLYYGIQGVAMSSIAAATVATVTLPSAGGSASGSASAVGGTYTVTPSTLQTSTTTSGNCYDEQVAFGIPFTYTNNTKVSFDQLFTTPGTTALTLQICGLKVYGNWIQ
jgi:hypothetical protein